MNWIRPGLRKFFSEQELLDMHACALKLIEEDGIKIPNSSLLDCFSKYEGVRIQANRLHIAPALVNRLIEEHRSRPGRPDMQEERRISLSPYNYADHIVDPDTGRIRPIMEKDLIRLTRLIDALHTAGYPVSGGCPGFAQDLPEQIRSMAQFRIAATYSRTVGDADLSSNEAAEYIFEMSKVVGRKSLSYSLFMFSPLRVDEASLDRIFHMVDRRIPVDITVQAMPLLGATTPISLQGALIQAIAEVLAGFVMMKLVIRGNPVDLWIKLFGFDMKHASVALGSAEEALLSSVCKEVTDFYCGVQSPNPYNFSMGNIPGEQNVLEKTANMLMKALSGCREFICAGATASGVFSPEQLVIDCEIVSYIDRIIRGYEKVNLEAQLQIIRESNSSGQFLDHDSTLEGFRTAYWIPRLFEHRTYPQWANSPGETLKARVGKIVEEMTQRHDYVLEEEKKQEIDRIYTEACKRMAGATFQPARPCIVWDPFP